jgi:hypothetical protein
MTPVVLNDTYDPASEKRPRKPVLCLRVYRDPSKFILIVCLPIMMIVLLALATFCAPPRQRTCCVGTLQAIATPRIWLRNGSSSRDRATHSR